MTRPGGNYTEPHIDLATRETSYRVVVGWQRQADEYASAVEAEQALRDAVARTRSATLEFWLDDDALKAWLT